MRKAVWLAVAAAAAFVACSEKEYPFEAQSVEAFAYGLGEPGLIEVQAVAMTRGYELREENEKFRGSLDYSFTIVTPSGEEIELGAGAYDEAKSKPIAETRFEAMTEIENAEPGEYVVVFTATDKHADATIEKRTTFLVEATDTTDAANETEPIE
jgi:hypothetical protein